jgi:hypothetical protein
MADWVKVLISALAGMVAGLIAEPIKGALQEEIKMRRMESSLALEMGYLVASIGIPREQWPERWWETHLSIERYEFSCQTQKESLLRSRHYNAIDSFYRQMNRAKEASAKNDNEALFEADEAVLIFEMLLSRKDLRPAFELHRKQGTFKNAFDTVHDRHL